MKLRANEASDTTQGKVSIRLDLGTRLDIPLAQTGMLLARVMIGKVTNKTQLTATLAAVPLVQDDTAWTCRIWVKDDWKLMGRAWERG